MTSLGTVEIVALDQPLASAIEQAFERLRSAGSTRGALVFHTSWHPTMDVVELVAAQLTLEDDVKTLTLVHPSAAMGVIASAIASRVQELGGGGIVVESKRSIYDDPEDEHTDATGSNTFFRMDPGESESAFVRRAVREARARAVRRVALILDRNAQPTMKLADILVEELLQSGVREVGLIHATAPLDAIASSVRLRLPAVRIALASERRGS
jgi:hypothetical protein